MKRENFRYLELVRLELLYWRDAGFLYGCAFRQCLLMLQEPAVWSCLWSRRTVDPISPFFSCYFTALFWPLFLV